MRLEERLRLASEYLKVILQINAPKLTGNLAFNSIHVLQISANHFRVNIGGEIAPYAVKLNNEGKHEGWVQKSVEMARPYMMNLLGGYITFEEAQEAILQERKLAYSWFDIRAKELGGV